MRIDSRKELADRLKSSLDKAEKQKLPGFIELLRSNKNANKAFIEKFNDIDRAMADADSILFEGALYGFLNVCWKVNQIIAEKHRKETEDPAQWDLRFIRFMKIKFIKFSSDMGDFYLVPFTPRVKPKAPHWFTVDEMLDMLGDSATLDMLLAFGGLPVRPESIEGPGPGEKHLLIDLTGPEMEVKYDMGEMI